MLHHIIDLLMQFKFGCLTMIDGSYNMYIQICVCIGAIGWDGMGPNYSNTLEYYNLGMLLIRTLTWSTMYLYETVGTLEEALFTNTECHFPLHLTSFVVAF